MTPLEMFFISLVVACSIFGMVWAHGYLGALWTRFLTLSKKEREALNPVPGPAFDKADWTDPQLAKTVAEVEKLQRHSRRLAVIHEAEKAHVKALYNDWQSLKKRASIYKPGSVNAIKATKRAALARKEWHAANTHYLNCFGDYAP